MRHSEKKDIGEPARLSDQLYCFVVALHCYIYYRKIHISGQNSQSSEEAAVSCKMLEIKEIEI